MAATRNHAAHAALDDAAAHETAMPATLDHAAHDPESCSTRESNGSCEYADHSAPRPRQTARSLLEAMGGQPRRRVLVGHVPPGMCVVSCPVQYCTVLRIPESAAAREAGAARPRLRCPVHTSDYCTE
jgi:hypothetical protein